MRGGWTAACAAMLMALAPGTSKSAQAEEFAPDLHGCAALYDTLDKAKKSQQQMALRLNSLYGFAEEDARWRDAGAFGVSNARQSISVNEGGVEGENRRAIFDIRAGISGRPAFPRKRRGGFPRRGLAQSQAPPRAPHHGHRISTCTGAWVLAVFYFGATDHLSVSRITGHGASPDLSQTHRVRMPRRPMLKRRRRPKPAFRCVAACRRAGNGSDGRETPPPSSPTLGPAMRDTAWNRSNHRRNAP